MKWNLWKHHHSKHLTGVEWCGVEWCIVEWGGFGWGGLGWCGMGWTGVGWCGVEWGGMGWCDVVELSLWTKMHLSNSNTTTILAFQHGNNQAKESKHEKESLD
jgi:hypothetical protein